MVETRTLVTGEELLELESRQDFPKYELVKGELVEMPPTGITHAGIAAQLAALLIPHARQNQWGRVFVDLGCYLERHPDTVRAPDVSLIRADRLPGQRQRGYFDGAPDLAIEVVSPGDTASELEQKVKAYFQHGTHRVWIVYPESQTVVVYREDGTGRRFNQTDTLVDEEFLPGFALPLAELFS